MKWGAFWWGFGTVGVLNVVTILGCYAIFDAVAGSTAGAGSTTTPSATTAATVGSTDPLANADLTGGFSGYSDPTGAN